MRRPGGEGMSIMTDGKPFEKLDLRGTWLYFFIPTFTLAAVWRVVHRD